MCFCVIVTGMDKTTKNLVMGGFAGILFITGGLFGVAKLNDRPGALDGFAQCLGEKGAVFYGAFWCPRCTSQKQAFGRSQKLLPYVECSTPNGKDQNDFCKGRAITGYPTWEFGDGERTTGELSLAALAERTSCVLPK